MSTFITDKETQLHKDETNWFHLILAVFLPFAIVGLIKTLIVTTFITPTDSMSPTIKPNDRVLASYMWVTPEINRGDIIVFEDTHNWARNLNMKDYYLLKRVIALGGDSIEISQGKLYVNNELVNEPYVWGETGDLPKYVIPQGHVFVMGDNREESIDSRLIHNSKPSTIPIDDIEAKTILIYWPFDELKML